MADVDKDGWALKPPVIDTANRRITVPPGAIDGSNFGDLGNFDLMGWLMVAQLMARLRKDSVTA